MSSQENINISWNDFDSHLRSSVKSLRNDSSFSDVTLICEDTQIKAHKFVLSSSSVSFNSILHANPHSHPLIYLNNVKIKHFMKLMDFMYTGQVEVAPEDKASVTEIFKQFKVGGLDPVTSVSHHPIALSPGQQIQRGFNPISGSEHPLTPSPDNSAQRVFSPVASVSDHPLTPSPDNSAQRVFHPATSGSEHPLNPSHDNSAQRVFHPATSGSEHPLTPSPDNSAQRGLIPVPSVTDQQIQRGFDPIPSVSEHPLTPSPENSLQRGLNPASKVSDDPLTPSPVPLIPSFPTTWIHKDVLDDVLMKTDDDQSNVQQVTNQSILTNNNESYQPETESLRSFLPSCTSSPGESLQQKDGKFLISVVSSSDECSLTEEVLDEIKPEHNISSIEAEASCPRVQQPPIPLNQISQSDSEHKLTRKAEPRKKVRICSPPADIIPECKDITSLPTEQKDDSSEPSRPVKFRKRHSSSPCNTLGLSKVKNKRSKEMKDSSCLKWNNVIKNAVVKIKSSKQAPNIKRIAGVVRRHDAQYENITEEEIEKKLDKAVEKGVVIKRVDGEGKVTYTITTAGT